MLDRMLRNLAPLAALALGAGLSGCSAADMRINGEEGVPLSELDMTGAAPSELLLAANAKVIVSHGDQLEVTVEGDTNDALRFVLEDDMLGISRDRDREMDGSKATVRITMPDLARIVIGGSGRVEAKAMTANPELVIGGSGSIAVEQIAAETLEITVGGSGKVSASGRADRLEVTVGGSGDVDMPGLQTDRADINIGGSGDVRFASDGRVDATIAGSGDVIVEGRATCSLKSLGSGKITCREPQPSVAALADEG